MPEFLQSGDRLIQWFTIRLGDSAASMVKYFPRLAMTNVPFLSTFIHNSCARTLLDLEPILGKGEYIGSSHLYLIRADVMIDNLNSGDIPLSVGGNYGPLPPNVTALSSFRPEPATPRRVARSYWPFIRTDFCSPSGDLTQAGRDEVQLLASKYLVTIDWGGSGYSARVRAGFDGTWPDPGQLFVTAATSPFFATQRRRLRGTQRATWGGI